MKMRQLLVIFALVFGFLLFPQNAQAHLLETNYQLSAEEDALEIKTQFTSGKPYKGAEVTIHPPSNSNYLEITGVTDENGTFPFRPDYSIPGEWSVEIGDELESNHWDMLTVPVTEENIKIEKISHVDRETYENHHSNHSNFASQIIVIAIALTCGIGVQLFRNRWKL